MADDIFKRMGKKAFGAAPVKRPATSVSDASPAAKKIVAAPTTVTGPSSSHAATPPASPGLPAADQPVLGPADAPPVARPATRQLPAFFIDASVDWPSVAADLKRKTDGDIVALARGDHIRVTTSTVDHFRAIQRHLFTAKVPFHTFTVRGTKSLRVVVSGLPWTITEDQVIEALEAEKFAVESACRLRSRRGRSGRWLVTMANDEEREPGFHRGVDVYRLGELLHVRVVVATYRRPPGPPQCHHCQRFGHGSGNCGRPARCVRCDGSHGTRDCQRPPEEKGVCCNCGGDHNANWRGCKAFADAVAAITPRPRGRPAPWRQRPAEPRTADQEEPAAEDDEEQSPAADDEGFTAVRRKKRRRPRNPDNRRPRKPQQTRRQEKPADEPQRKATAPVATAAPPKRVVETTRPETTEEERPADADTGAAILALRSELQEVRKDLKEFTSALTGLTGLMGEMLRALAQRQ